MTHNSGDGKCFRAAATSPLHINHFTLQKCVPEHQHLYVSSDHWQLFLCWSRWWYEAILAHLGNTLHCKSHTSTSKVCLTVNHKLWHRCKDARVQCSGHTDHSSTFKTSFSFRFFLWLFTFSLSNTHISWLARLRGRYSSARSDVLWADWISLSFHPKQSDTETKPPPPPFRQKYHYLQLQWCRGIHYSHPPLPPQGEMQPAVIELAKFQPAVRLIRESPVLFGRRSEAGAGSKWTVAKSLLTLCSCHIS